MDEITADLERALDRIEESEAIHHGRPFDERLEAVLCLQEAVGIGEQARALVRERIYERALAGPLSGPEEGRRPTAVFLGLIVGLLAAQYESERLDPGS